MRGFTGTFLREGKRLFSFKAKPGVQVGVFGKHPGWDDHMEGLGIETPSLVAMRQVLYVEGIGGLINAGTWEKLGEEQRLGGFEHLFVWKREGTFLIGKIWSSRDGKGRAKYPMIACAQCQGMPLEAAMRVVLPVLEQYEVLCKETTASEKVREGFAAVMGELRGKMIEEGEGLKEVRLEREGEFLARINPAGGDEIFYRVLHALQNEPGNLGLRDWEERPMRMRLPGAAGLEREGLVYWNRVLEEQTEGRAPVFTAAPGARDWVDALIGKPRDGDFYFLQAGRKAVAISSEVDVEMDERFRERNERVVEGMRGGGGGKG